MLRAELLQELKTKTLQVKQQAEALLKVDEQKLRQRSAPEKWNALECIEHLNLYGDFYLKEIEQKILSAPARPNATTFKAGFIGNKFALSLKPAEEGKKFKSMRTFKDKNTLNAPLNANTISRFIKQQNRMLTLLKQAENVDLTKVKTAISISNFIKLRLGDTFRVVVYHNQRHLAQAIKATAE